MDHLEHWLAFRNGERIDNTKPSCWHCGWPCSGDTIERVNVDGTVDEVPVCDDADACDFRS